ncbi:adenylate cyclase type 2 isoform X2 [Tachysurus ichikawai]
MEPIMGCQMTAPYEITLLRQLKCSRSGKNCANYNTFQENGTYKLKILKINILSIHPWKVSFFLFIIFVVYTMLPFSMRDAIIASVLTCSSHTVVLSVCLSAISEHPEELVWQCRSAERLRKTSALTAGMPRARCGKRQPANKPKETASLIKQYAENEY